MGELSETKIKKATTKDGKRVRLYDRDGLYLIVGERSKTFFHRHKENNQTFNIKVGEWPEMSLLEAREKALKIKSKEVTTSQEEFKEFRKEKSKKRITLNRLFELWEASQKEKKLTEAHLRAIRFRYNAHVKDSFLGTRYIDEIEYQEVKTLLRKIEKKTHNGKPIIETAHRIQVMLSLMFRFAKIEDFIQEDKIGRKDELKGILKVSKSKPLAALTSLKERDELGKLLRDIEETNKFVTSIHFALRITPFVALRPNELAGGRWEEVDFDNKLWTIPASRMKGKEGSRTNHLVPLADGVVSMLKELKALNLSEELMFPSMAYSKVKTYPISNVAVGNALVSFGYKDRQTSHGFRAVFKTIAMEELDSTLDVTELCLHHFIGAFTPNGVSYHRAEFINKRRELMEKYEEFLIKLRNKK